MKKLLIIGLCLAIALLSAGCRNKDGDTADERQESAASSAEDTAADQTDEGIYRFTDYESEDVFNIERVDTGSETQALCTTYRFSYLSDGFKINAYISIPAAAIRSQEKCKCLLYNRGGNSRIGQLEDRNTADMCAAVGRIVIASQYRGAAGSEGADHFGGSDLNDVIRLIDLCEDRFSFVDMDDFCVAGISRGGMMTYMAARQDTRIKRIICVAAMSDLFAGYDEREDMQDLLYEYIGCTPEQDPAEYEKRSAVYWADEITVPVLIIHSKQDPQVSFSQAEEMAEKLKDHTECTFITYEDDVHAFHHEDIPVIREWLK